MAVHAPSDFVAMAVADLQGAQGPSQKELHERSRHDSPSMAAFVDMAVGDLQGVQPVESGKAISEKIKENADELRDAFARSVAAPSAGVCEETEKVIEDFKKEAEDEAMGTLEKLLKAIR